MKQLLETLEWNGKYVIAMVKTIFLIADFNPESDPQKVQYILDQNFIVVSEATPNELLCLNLEINESTRQKLEHIEKLAFHMDSIVCGESFMATLKRRMIRSLQQILPTNVGIDKVYCT
jgi:hypothetical protein